MLRSHPDKSLYEWKSFPVISQPVSLLGRAGRERWAPLTRHMAEGRKELSSAAPEYCLSAGSCF